VTEPVPVAYLSTEDLRVAGERLFGGKMPVRDWGLLEAALARPKATAFGQDAYPDLHSKAGALVHSIATSHPLVDGNKRLALMAVLLFYGFNGYRLTATEDERVEIIVAIAAGELDSVPAIAERLAAWVVRR
jgi:death on curing protein